MAITFRVNLETQQKMSHLRPVAPSDDADNFRSTRSTWFPNVFNGNYELKHNDEFTVEGEVAYHLKRTYTTGDDPILIIV